MRAPTALQGTLHQNAAADSGTVEDAGQVGAGHAEAVTHLLRKKSPKVLRQLDKQRPPLRHEDARRRAATRPCPAPRMTQAVEQHVRALAATGHRRQVQQLLRCIACNSAEVCGHKHRRAGQLQLQQRAVVPAQDAQERGKGRLVVGVDVLASACQQPRAEGAAARGGARRGARGAQLAVHLQRFGADDMLHRHDLHTTKRSRRVSAFSPAAFNNAKQAQGRHAQKARRTGVCCRRRERSALSMPYSAQPRTAKFAASPTLSPAENPA